MFGFNIEPGAVISLIVIFAAVGMYIIFKGRGDGIQGSALESCETCGKEMSVEAAACPACGHPNSQKRKNMGCGGLVLVALFAIIFIPMMCVGAAQWDSAGRDKRIAAANRAEVKKTQEQATIAKKKQEAQAAKEKKYFNDNRTAILAETKELYKRKKYSDVVAKGESYTKYDKEIEKLYGKALKEVVKVKEAQYVAKARKIPASDLAANVSVYGRLKMLRPDNKRYQEKYTHYKTKLDQVKNNDLALIKWSWGETAGGSYVEAKGFVQNVSAVPLENVTAHVIWKTKNGDFITSDYALIDYDPLLPGQKSPFNVLERSNPAMSKASIDFKTISGGSIRWYRQ